IVVMSEGNVEQIGAPLDLFDRPANRFVARFIGSPSMNLIEGRIEGSGDAPVFVAGALRLPLPTGAAVVPGQAVTLGFRPEHVTLAAAGDSALAGEVTVVEPTGTETLLHVQVGDETVLAVLRQRLTVVPGDRIFLAVDGAQVHLFDAASANRL